MLKNSNTSLNLIKAYVREYKTRTRYTFFASIAKKEGYNRISKIFLEIAEQEKEHAKLFYKHLKDEYNGEDIFIDASYPVAFFQSTKENLQSAVKGEFNESTLDYPLFAKTALKEGFDEISKLFYAIANIEYTHEKRFNKLYLSLETDSHFFDHKGGIWRCSNCGFIIEDVTPPGDCPVCRHSKSYFENIAETY